MSGAGEVVCSGWLRKSPPEKKLRRYAWKKRWFVLRSGRLSGDPDVLEYYKSEGSRKPLRIIDLNLCEQVDAGLSFDRKEFLHSFIFDVRTLDRTFYLVADSEEEMNRWVQCICSVCGFNPHDDDQVKSNSAAVGSGPLRRTSATGGAAVSQQPLLSEGGAVTSPPPPYALPTAGGGHGESEAPRQDGTSGDGQEYFLLAECVTPSSSAEGSSTRSTAPAPRADEYFLLGDCGVNCTPADPSPVCDTDLNHNAPPPVTSKGVMNGVVPPAYDLAPGPPCPPLPPPPSATADQLEVDGDLSGGIYSYPRSYSMSSEQPTYDTPPSAPTSSSLYQVPCVFRFDGGQTTPAASAGGASPTSLSGGPALPPDAGTPPPRPPKPSAGTPAGERDAEAANGGGGAGVYSYPRSQSESDGGLYLVPPPTVARRSNTISSLDGAKAARDSYRLDSYDYPRTTVSDVGHSLESVGDGYSSYMRKKSLQGGSESDLEQNYVAMVPSPGHEIDSPVTSDTNYIPMSPAHVEGLSPPTSQGGPPLTAAAAAAAPAPGSGPSAVPPPPAAPRRGSNGGPPRRSVVPAEVQLPPPVNRDLKPDRKGGDRKGAKPPPLVIKPVDDIDGLMQAPVRSPLTKTYGPQKGPSFRYSRRPDSVHSTASSSGSEEADPPYIPMKNQPASASPTQTASNAGSPMPPGARDCVEYLKLDLPGSPASTKQKSAAPSPALTEEKVDYVTVDKEKTLALQNTKEAWQDKRQISENDVPSKGTK
uniref:GRB2-associated-binding protein 1-like isoform X1 n=2 Tax=Petromyzon marinus TaxID=7757 RepID=A0AAJ7WWH1_PETMA|nr:GRB2-associated-binding protein 1-like isoform X1 [Petromyzon marinus]